MRHTAHGIAAGVRRRRRRARRRRHRRRLASTAPPSAGAPMRRPTPTSRPAREPAGSDPPARRRRRRRLRHRRQQHPRRQRLAGGDDLRGQGPVARQRPGQRGHRHLQNGGPTEQIQDLQNLISQGVDAIIVNPSDREQLNPVIEEAIAQGIVVVAVDQAVTAEGAYVATNDQVEYGRLGAQWLADDLGGEGSVLYMRGIEGVPADDDRNTGFQEVMARVPRHRASRRCSPAGTTPRAATSPCRS